MAQVKINFSNEEAARQFIDWLDGQGEQDYWTWMEYREEENDNPELTATEFIYDVNDKSNLEINTKSGRMDG
jgi:ABC-type Fe3+ transport system substrate-binding protein